VSVSRCKASALSRLQKSYRNTAEILTLARNFSKVEDAPFDPDAESAMESLLFPIDVNRHGQPPQMICELNEDDQIRFILNQILDSTDNGLCSWCDIGVFYTSQHFAKNFSSAFKKRFDDEKLYWVSESRESKMNLNLASPSAKLSTIESAKGMEFRLVFLVGLDLLPRADRDQASERKLAYVGLTRAQDLLYLLGNTPSGFFKELLEIS
jgi:superfamily I DNA/RNA helicase